MKEFNFKINGNSYTVGIAIQGDNEAEVVVNGAAYHVELVDTTVKPKVVSKPQIAAIPASHPVQFGSAVSKNVVQKAAPVTTNTVYSPLPGVIIDLKVKEGDIVTVGQTLLVLEAMKMENNIDADFAGVVKSINVKCGDTVLDGNVLLIIG